MPVLSPDIEELIVSYLSTGLSNVSVEMPATPTYPFYLVNHLTGHDDYVTEYPVLSIHAFDTTRTAASDAARAMHKMMKDLTAKIPILMSDGSYVSVDYIYVIEAPHWEDYGDKEIHRYCGRYRVETRLNLTT